MFFWKFAKCISTCFASGLQDRTCYTLFKHSTNWFIVKVNKMSLKLNTGSKYCWFLRMRTCHKTGLFCHLAVQLLPGDRWMCARILFESTTKHGQHFTYFFVLYDNKSINLATVTVLHRAQSWAEIKRTSMDDSQWCLGLTNRPFLVNLYRYKGQNIVFVTCWLSTALTKLFQWLSQTGT